MDTKLFIRPGLPTETQVVDMPEDPGFHGLRPIVEQQLDGGALEHVTVLFENRRADMFVDELGAIKRLPMNEAATAIYRAASLRRDPDIDPDALPAIFGPAVLFDRIVWR